VREPERVLPELWPRLLEPLPVARVLPRRMERRRELPRSGRLRPERRHESRKALEF
jgi:hypothetical protein